MLKLDKVIARLNKGWTKGTLHNSYEDKCCLYGAINLAEVGSYNFSSREFPDYVQDYADALSPIIRAEFPRRVVGLAHDDCNVLVAFNNHPDTTLDDVLMVCEKAWVNEL